MDKKVELVYFSSFWLLVPLEEKIEVKSGKFPTINYLFTLIYKMDFRLKVLFSHFIVKFLNRLRIKIL
jgi:hypothetical protein